MDMESGEPQTVLNCPDISTASLQKLMLPSTTIILPLRKTHPLPRSNGQLRSQFFLGQSWCRVHLHCGAYNMSTQPYLRTFPGNPGHGKP